MRDFRGQNNIFSKLITSRTFLFLLVPIAILILEVIMKAALDDIDSFIQSFGVSLSTISLATIFPLIVSEQFLMAKIFFFRTEISLDKKSLSLQYELKSSVDSKRYKNIKNATITVFICSLLLFLLSILTNYTAENIFYKNIIGVINAIVITVYYAQG